MAKVEGRQYLLEQQLCEALELDPKAVQSLTIRFAAGGVAQASVVLFPDKEHLDRLVRILKQYELVPKEY